MAKHLTDNDVNSIINIIEGWPNQKITWDKICEEAIQMVGKRPTRQSLNSNKQIKAAYAAKQKGIILNGTRVAVPSSLSVAGDRIGKLQNEIRTLKAINSELLEQFGRWLYNSHKYGIKEHQLNEPLPKIDRERTDKKLK